MGALEGIHAKLKREFLMEFYEIARFESSDQFVSLVAHKLDVSKVVYPIVKLRQMCVRDLYTGNFRSTRLPSETLQMRRR